MSDKVQYLEITDAAEGQRLDNFLLARLKGVPKTLIYRIIRKGEVRVNKGRAKPDRKLVLGDSVRVPPVRTRDAAEPVMPSVGLQRRLEASILYDQGGLMIVNKPSGLAVHGGSGISLGLIESLRQMQPPGRFLELVHRLDRETSGCVMVARKRSMLKYLQELLRKEKQITKEYVALVKGHWPSGCRLVDAPLLKTLQTTGERFVRVNPEGKSSRTAFEVLETFADTTLVKARPLTGRTHQIRVHALSQGHPLVGDSKYGDDRFNELSRKGGAKRLFLHAQSLVIPMPEGESLRVEAPLPDDLQLVLQSLRKPNLAQPDD